MNTFDKLMINLINRTLQIYNEIEKMQYDISMLARIHNDESLKIATQTLAELRVKVRDIAYIIRDFWVKH